MENKRQEEDIVYTSLGDFFRINIMRILFALILISCSILLIYFFVTDYKVFVRQDIASVQVEGIDGPILENYPTWFYISQDTMSTRKVMTDMDKVELCSLLPKKDSTYVTFKTAIDKLAYDSNNNGDYFKMLNFLLIYMALIGCNVRSLYDFIGHYCFLKDLRLTIWWPWYVLRPVIAASLAVFFAVLSKGNVFEITSLQSANNLLVIVFLAGFAIQDVIALLRNVSQSLFDHGKVTSKA